jgi:hypothetical protein
MSSINFPMLAAQCDQPLDHKRTTPQILLEIYSAAQLFTKTAARSASHPAETRHAP